MISKETVACGGGMGHVHVQLLSLPYLSISWSLFGNWKPYVGVLTYHKNDFENLVEI